MIFDENLMENVDKTHFVVNGRTLGFKGDNVVKYVDVILEGDSMTMVIRIFGGVPIYDQKPYAHLY